MNTKPYQDLSFENLQQDVLELEMALQNASLAHEYTRLELETVRSALEKIALDEKLESYREAYFIARKCLQDCDPARLQKVEAELIDQKKEFFTFYSA